MSFQGDVGGIGLADLLQSLARGRAGILTLNAKGGMRACLGIQDGQIHFLPEQDEDPEIWRNRVRQAWVKDPDFRIDALRMTDIARAQRIDTIYTLLDADQVHFRFLPGPVPKPPEPAAISSSEPGTARTTGRRDAVFCAPISVEGMLLEYARLKDEHASAGIRFVLPEYVLLVPVSTETSASDSKRMFEELDGRSTLLEIADRLGWPLRQLRNLASVALVHGAVRPPELHELLDQTLRELVDGNTARAAARLRAWIELSPPGPLSADDLAVLTTEWTASRLQSAMRELPRRLARRLIRRLDVTQGLPLAACDYWTEFLRLHVDDRVAAVALLFAQVRAATDPNKPALKDILAVARTFSNDGSNLRAAALYRVAAARNPDAIEQRLEIGLGLLAARLSDEGIPWVIDAAAQLIEQKKPELAIEPLRRALEFDATQREARRLLSRARTQVVQRTITRKNSLVTIAIVLALSIGAVVTYGANRESEKKFADVTARLSEPHLALKLLEEQFPNDPSSRVHDLRQSLLERCKAEDNAARTAWTDKYREAQLECTIGDPKLGLARALALPVPPKLAAAQDPLPLVSDLFNGLSARLDKTLKDAGDDVIDDTAQVHAEERLQTLVEELRGVLDEKASPAPEAKDFAKRLDGLAQTVRKREDARAAARTERERKDNLQRQDLYLATARAHAQAGDYVRSLDAYGKLLDSDQTGKLRDLLKKEMDLVTKKGGAVAEARRLANAGDHEAAVRVLTGAVDSPRNYLLPWKLETFPSGARARFKDGSVKTTPLAYESAVDDAFDVQLELDGYERATVHVAGPKNQFLYLSRVPERAWKAEGRVEALPVSTGDDEIVCDRAGNVVRLTATEGGGWSKKLGSLGGVARTPVYLPGKGGHLLLVTEDGESWTIDVATGELEGPQRLPNPPLEGPVLTDDGAVARLRDGALAVWRSSGPPEIVAPRDLGPQHAAVQQALADAGAFGVRQGMSVLRRRTDSATRLASTEGGWSVEIASGVYLVKKDGAAEPSFSIHRRGEWSYLAWEAPRALLPHGRLWIADEGGLRSFVP